MENQNFEIIAAADLKMRVGSLKADGYRFAQLCATNNSTKDGFEVLYTFVLNGETVKNLKVLLSEGQSIDSITSFYFNAFVNENEMHDLFGINVNGNALDFGGNFYKVAVPTPMKAKKEAE